MKTSRVGIEMIKRFEQVHDGDKVKPGLQPQMCPSKVWTVGYGRALVNKKTGKHLKGLSDKAEMERQYPEFMSITLAQAESMLLEDLKKEERKILTHVKVPLKQHEFDALVSYCYNIGQSDTMWGLLNRKASQDEIKKWWENHYITGNGVVLSGLVKRRKSEYYLFSTGKVDYFGL